MILIYVGPLLALAAAGCGGTGGGGGDGADVMATTGIAADIVRAVAGPDARVDQLLPGSASPHGYSASAKDRARLEQAGLVVAWGSGLEETLPLDGLDTFELAGPSKDPHVWMDPTFVADRLPQLAAALAERDPDHASDYRRRAAAYAAHLRELDRRMRRTLATIPAADRKLVTSHDALGHFASRYDFEFVGAPFGLTPDAEASAEKVARLIAAVEREHVPAVFAEDTDDPKLMRQIAREAGVEVVDDLLVEGFGDRASSYDEILLYDAHRIADALTP
jgi:ABC-type Zn uptake system ZnuABC Zn-binding protein ZnuA